MGGSTIWEDGTTQPLQHALVEPKGRLCKAVLLPPSTETNGGWHRISPRAHADWPLIEGVYSQTPELVRVALGGIAPQPLLFESKTKQEIRGLISDVLDDKGIRQIVQYKRTLLDPLLNELLGEG